MQYFTPNFIQYYYTLFVQRICIHFTAKINQEMHVFWRNNPIMSYIIFASISWPSRWLGGYRSLDWISLIHHCIHLSSELFSWQKTTTISVWLWLPCCSGAGQCQSNADPANQMCLSGCRSHVTRIKICCRARCHGQIVQYHFALSNWKMHLYKI